ncbi:MAG TPA: acyloxyacyl hydrolase [Salinimicrobium sp.]|nr:acyloxyacyl hydrolase [Salinimicrobium sp.]
MKKIFYCMILLWGGLLSAQEKDHYSVELSYFYGNIIEHNTDLAHLITGHPEGIILSWNRKTYGYNQWESRFNYPDVGFSFTYQDMKNPYLGENFGLYGHMAFYFLNRNLVIKIGQGLAIASNPYDHQTNYHNNAYGSRILSSTFFSGNFKKENLFYGFGFQAGLAMIHYSNADFKSPNISTNTMTVNFGLNYFIDRGIEYQYLPGEKSRYTEPVHLNFALRSGVNTIGVIGSESFPFLTLAVYADKRLSRVSTLQGGAEFFFSGAMKEYIHYQSVTFPYGDTTGEEDSKRAGLFIGHQLTFNKLSLITHAGAYVYYPYKNYAERIYLRIGLQRPIYRNIFGSVTVRAHGINAEAVEFTLGYRL